MQNCTFLVLLRPIFTQKTKKPPSKRFGSRSSEVVAAIRPEEPFKSVISAEKSDSISVKTFSSEITCFWAKNCLNLIQEQWKFGSRSLTVVSTFQKSPPPLLRNPGYAPAQATMSWYRTYEPLLSVRSGNCIFIRQSCLGQRYSKDTSRNVIQKTS